VGHPVTVDVAALAAEVRRTRQHLDREAGRAVQVAEAGMQAEAEVERLTARVDLYARTAALLTTVGERAQEDARAKFEDLATRALRVIFAENLSFHLVAGESGGQVTLEPVIRSEHPGGVVIDTPVMDARGGGMAAVAGFALQLVMVLLDGKARKIIFLDESFGFVSEAYVDRVAEFLREVTRSAVQIVMITHNRVFAQYADVRVRLALGPDGLTQVFEGETELCRFRLRGRSPGLTGRWPRTSSVSPSSRLTARRCACRPR